MTRTLQLKQMSREEKLVAMEAIWADLSSDPVRVESPSWHKDALAETEARVACGQEPQIDWDVAKQQLRQRAL